MKRANLWTPQARLRRLAVRRNSPLAQMNRVDPGNGDSLQALAARGTIQRIDAGGRYIHPPAVTQFERRSDLLRLRCAWHKENEIGFQWRGRLRADDLQNLAGFQGRLVTIDAADGEGAQSATHTPRRNSQLTRRASQHLAVNGKPSRQQKFDLGVEEIVLVGAGGALAGGHRFSLRQAATVCGDGETATTVPLVIRTISPRSAPVISR